MNHEWHECLIIKNEMKCHKIITRVHILFPQKTLAVCQRYRGHRRQEVQNF
jgi:hypothetical protein